MLNRAHNRIRASRGFTVAEGMIVLAFAAVLFGAAALAGTSMLRDARQQELDRTAGEIYAAASRSIKSIEASGDAAQLRIAAAAQGEAQSYAQPLTLTIGGKTLGGSGQYQIYALSDQDALYRTLLPEGTLGAEPETGRVYVVYAVDTTGGACTVLEVYYTTAEYKEYFSDNIVNGDGTKREALRAYAERLADGAKVGYYSGVDGGEPKPAAAPLNAESFDPDRFTCRMSVDNGEKLTVTLNASVPNSSLYNPNYSDATTYPTVTFELTVADAHGEKKQLSETGAGESETFEGGKVKNFLYTATITLDSLESQDTQFKTVCAGLTPGDDLSLTVDAKCGGRDAERTQDAYKTVNSLFARRASHFTDGSVNDFDQVEIACGRHLQNLDSALSGMTDSVPLRAVQTADIDFSAWDETYPGKTFAPIINEKLEAYNGRYIDAGNNLVNYTIKNLTVDLVNATLRPEPTGTDAEIEAATKLRAENAGLFGVFYGTKLSNITLIDPVIADAETAPVNAGGLAGRTTAALTVANCALHMTNETGSPLQTLLVGGKYANGAEWLSASRCAGGLVGFADEALSVENSFAATVVKTPIHDTDPGEGNRTYAGGLLGYSAAALTVEGCYADCYLVGEYVGGLAGACGAESTFNSCYSAGFVLADGKGGRVTAAGFAPCAVKQLAQTGECYSLFNFDDATTFDGSAVTFAGGGKYGAVQSYPDVAAGNTAATKYAFVESVSVASGQPSYYTYSGAANTVEKAQYAALSDSAKYVEEKDAAVYKLAACLGALPEGTVLPAFLPGLSHYGDWLERPGVTFTVTFDSDGGSAVDAQTVASGGKATKPADPTKDGYNFKGWKLNGADYDFNTPVTENIKLTAVWEGKYKITFNLGEGEGKATAIPVQIVDKGGKATQPGSQTYTDGEYTKFLLGWYDTPELTTAYDFSSPVTEDLTLYAKWYAYNNTARYNLDETGRLIILPGKASELIDYLNNGSSSNLMKRLEKGSWSGLYTKQSQIKSIDFSLIADQLNAQASLNMSYLFKDLTNIEYVNFGDMNFENVTLMKETFSGCTGLKTVTFGDWNTDKLTNAFQMFTNCSSLTTIYVRSCGDFSKVSNRDTTLMFTKCTNLVGGNGTKWTDGTNKTETRSVTYARIDTESTPGYFTLRAEN